MAVLSQYHRSSHPSDHMILTVQKQWFHTHSQPPRNQKQIRQRVPKPSGIDFLCWKPDEPNANGHYKSRGNMQRILHTPTVYNTGWDHYTVWQRIPDHLGPDGMCSPCRTINADDKTAEKELTCNSYQWVYPGPTAVTTRPVSRPAQSPGNQKPCCQQSQTHTQDV